MKMKWTMLGMVVFFLISVVMTCCFIWQYRMPKLKTGKVYVATTDLQTLRVVNPHMDVFLTYSLTSQPMWAVSLWCNCSFVEAAAGLHRTGIRISRISWSVEVDFKSCCRDKKPPPEQWCVFLDKMTTVIVPPPLIYYHCYYKLCCKVHDSLDITNSRILLVRLFVFPSGYEWKSWLV